HTPPAISNWAARVHPNDRNRLTIRVRAPAPRRAPIRYDALRGRVFERRLRRRNRFLGRLGGGVAPFDSRAPPPPARSAVGGRQEGARRRRATTVGRGAQPPSEALHVAAAFEGLRQCHLVGVLEVAAHGKAARDARDPPREGLQQLGQVDRRRLALDARVGGENDLLHRLALEADQQLAYLEILGTDPVE